MEEAVLQAFNLLLSVAVNVFNFLFFWLPVDPLAEYLDSVELASVAPQALRWLNWFVDVELFAGVLFMFISIMLLFAAWRALVLVWGFVRDAVESVPVVE